MIYSLDHEDQLKQGDICWKLPMITSKQMKYPLGSSKIGDKSVWKEYTEYIKEERLTEFKISVIPTLVSGTILTQTCDIRKGNDILLGRLLPLFSKTSWPKPQNLPKSITKVLRDETRRHYFPSLPEGITLNEGKGPYYLDLKTLFLLPAEMIIDNMDIYWKARMIEPARKVLCEKIQRYFTRLPFDDILFFTNTEIITWLEQKEVTKEEVIKVLKSVGREEDLNEILST